MKYSNSFFVGDVLFHFVLLELSKYQGLSFLFCLYPFKEYEFLIQK